MATVTSPRTSSVLRRPQWAVPDKNVRLGRVEERGCVGCVAKLAILDFEETDAGERVEEPRQTVGPDFEHGPKTVSSHRATTKLSEDAKVQPGAKRQGGGTAAIRLSIRSESTMSPPLPRSRTDFEAAPIKLEPPFSRK